MSDEQLRTIAKTVYIALGYGSRSERIDALLNSSDLDVAMLAQILANRGLLPMVR